jgi:hypothetical protein
VVSGRVPVPFFRALACVPAVPFFRALACVPAVPFFRAMACVPAPCTGLRPILFLPRANRVKKTALRRDVVVLQNFRDAIGG